MTLKEAVTIVDWLFAFYVDSYCESNGHMTYTPLAVIRSTRNLLDGLRRLLEDKVVTEE